MTATIVIPCYNEARRLQLARFDHYLSTNPGDRILFVDDGSSDETGRLLAGFCAEHGSQTEILTFDRNQGKAEAVRQGVVRAMQDESDVVAFCDADLAAPLESIRELADLMGTDTEIRMVYGSRIKLLGVDIERSMIRHILGRIFGWTVVIATGIPVYDTQCGAKLFRKDGAVTGVFAEPFSSRWLFDVEILLRYARASGLPPDRLGEHVREWPLSVWHDQPGSKVGPGVRLRAIVDLIRICRKER